MAAAIQHMVEEQDCSSQRQPGVSAHQDKYIKALLADPTIRQLEALLEAAIHMAKEKQDNLDAHPDLLNAQGAVTTTHSKVSELKWQLTLQKGCINAILGQ